MKTSIKIITALVLVFLFGLHGCYEDYVNDFDYSVVYFGAQKPLRTLVARQGQDELVFKIGVGIGGLHKDLHTTKTYEVKYMYDPDLLNTVEGAETLTELPKDWYTIDNGDDFTFYIPPGKAIGDCPVRINKEKFVSDPGSLGNKYALPFRLLTTTADSILANKNWTIIVIKYVDERSGYYWCRGWQAEWDVNTQLVIPSTKQEYTHVDDHRNRLRLINTLSLTRFELQGMGTQGNLSGSAPAADQMIIELVDGNVSLVRKAANTNDIEDLGSSYNPNDKTFTLNYIYTKADKSYRVFEELKLRQDVEKELRFEVWMEEEEIIDEG